MAAQIKIADLIADARVRLDKALSDMKKMEKQVDKGTGKMEDDFENVGKKGTGIFAKIKSAAGNLKGVLATMIGAAVFGGMTKLVSLASDTEESLNKVREVFGAAAGEIEEFSKRGAAALGASTEETLAMTGEIGNLLVAMGSTSKEAAGMSKKIVTLAADLGSFNNVPTAEALNAIRSALVGEAEPIRRFGSDIRVARLESIGMAKGISKSAIATNALTKAQLALEAIFQDTAKAQGDFARTSDGLANSIKILWAQLKDFAAGIGSVLIPAVSKVIGFFKDFISAITTDRIDKFINKLRELGAASGVIEQLELQRDINKALKERVKIAGEFADAQIKHLSKEKQLTDAAKASGGIIQDSAIAEAKRQDAIAQELKDLVEMAKITDDITGVQEKQRALTDELVAITKDLADAELGRNNLSRIEIGNLQSRQSLLENLLGQSQEFLTIAQQRIQAEETIAKLQNEQAGIVPPAAQKLKAPKAPEIPHVAFFTEEEIKEQERALEKFLEKALEINSEFDLTPQKMKELKDELKAGVTQANQLEGALDSSANSLGRALATGEGLKRVLAQAAAMAAQILLPGPLGGFVSGVFGGLFAKEGGKFKGTNAGVKKIASAASGANFMVKDNEMLLAVHRNEHVDVTPVSKVGQESKQLGAIEGAIKVMNANVVVWASRQDKIEAHLNISERGITAIVEKTQDRTSLYR